VSDQDELTFSFLISSQLKVGKFVLIFVLTLIRVLKMLIIWQLN